MFTVMCQMAILIAAGMLWRLFAPDHLSALSHRRALTDVVFFILLPALVLDVLWQAPFDVSTASIALTALSRLLVNLSVMWVCCRLMALNRPQQGALLLAATFPNAMYLGLPVTSEVMGEWSQAITLKYDLFACTPTLLTVGILLAQHYGGSAVKAHPLSALMRVPPLWALLLAVVLNFSDTPEPAMVQHALHTLAGGVVPLMLIALGMSIRWDVFSWHLLNTLLPVCVLALLVGPWVAWHVAQALGLPHEIVTTVTLLAAMPTMVFGVVICERYQLDSTLYAAAVFTTTLLSMVSLPFWFYVL